ncbi:uncharacterized protein [Prorops nasuta]|uniref:uncharacterized protein n=1 Tax=Prorops nasuta TaxID=863751 RepID=UPI0034CD9DF0
MASTIHFENGLTKNSGATKFVNNHKKEQQNFVASSFKENKIIQKKSSHVLSRNSQEMWNEKNLIKKNIFESPVKEHNAFEIKTPKQFSNDRNYQNWRNDSPFARMKREKEEFVNTREKHNSPAYNLKPEDVSPFKKFLSTELSNHYYGFRKEDTVTQFSPRSFSSLATVPVEGSENELNSTIPFDNKDFGSTIQLDSSDEFYDSKTIILSTPFESCSDNRVNISQDLFSSPELSRGKAFYSNTNVNKNKTITLSPYSALLSPTISVLSGISSSNVSPFEKSTGKNLDFSVEQTAKTNTKLFNPAIFSKQVNNELKDFNDSQNFPTFDTQTFLANYSFEHETMTEKQKYAPLFNKKSSRYELHVFKNSFVGDSNKIKSNIRNAIAILDNIDI